MDQCFRNLAFGERDGELGEPRKDPADESDAAAPWNLPSNKKSKDPPLLWGPSVKEKDGSGPNNREPQQQGEVRWSYMGRLWLDETSNQVPKFASEHMGFHACLSIYIYIYMCVQSLVCVICSLQSVLCEVCRLCIVEPSTSSLTCSCAYAVRMHVYLLYMHAYVGKTLTSWDDPGGDKQGEIIVYDLSSPE